MSQRTSRHTLGHVFQSFKTKDRVTVMVIGDPHVKSFEKNEDYETCNELQYFAKTKRENETMAEEYYPTGNQTSTSKMNHTTGAQHAEEPVILISNERFTIEGMLSRWSPNLNGTFFSEVRKSYYIAHTTSLLLSLLLLLSLPSFLPSSLPLII